MEHSSTLFYATDLSNENIHKIADAVLRSPGLLDQSIKQICELREVRLTAFRRHAWTVSWSREYDVSLLQAVSVFGAADWVSVARAVLGDGAKANECMIRYWVIGNSVSV